MNVETESAAEQENETETHAPRGRRSQRRGLAIAQPDRVAEKEKESKAENKENKRETKKETKNREKDKEKEKEKEKDKEKDKEKEKEKDKEKKKQKDKDRTKADKNKTEPKKQTAPNTSTNALMSMFGSPAPGSQNMAFNPILPMHDAVSTALTGSNFCDSLLCSLCIAGSWKQLKSPTNCSR
jgi:hypothetical protein